MSRPKERVLDAIEKRGFSIAQPLFLSIGTRGRHVRGVGDSNSWGCKQPSAVLNRAQYPHWEHSPKRD